jgi:predicted SprT family Zn-dependent metalloprotease
MEKTPAQQVIDKCKQVVERAKELYGLDLSQVKVSFDLRGTAAGRAGGKGYSMPGHAYYVKFNRDMLTREAFEHVLNDTVPHEYAHVVCYMNPALGHRHNTGWAKICRELGGTGARVHREEVVYGKGTTYEYVTDRGHAVRLSDKFHKAIQAGQSVRYRRGLGTVTKACAYSIVGYQGRTLANPIAKQGSATKEVPVSTLLPEVRSPSVPRVPAFNSGESKASVARAIMLSGHRAGKCYEEIIAAIMHATGHDRQLARAYYKNNVERTGVPPAP